MPDYQSLTPTQWDCNYPMVFIPKQRQQWSYGSLRNHVGEIFHELARRRGTEMVEGHLRRDPVHRGLRMPPKYSVAQVGGSLKGKRAIAIARQFRGKQRNCNGEHCWARGYFVATVALDERVVREYLRNQESNDEYSDQLKLGM